MSSFKSLFHQIRLDSEPAKSIHSILPKDKINPMNKLIVITGGTRGIGRAIAEKFAASGFDLVIAARNQSDLDTMKTEFQKAYAIWVDTFSCDLSDKIQANAFATFVTGLHRPVNILVNNAGHFAPGKVTDETEGTLERMINSNVYSAYNVTRGLLPVIRKGKGSHIFNMCSIASITAYPNGGSYSISKFALLGFSKVLREELKAEGIRVTSVMPGATMTSSWEGSGIPDERLMKASDVADAIYGAYQLSDRSVVEEIILRPQLGDI
jgi:short-subunit dehydrogenase